MPGVARKNTDVAGGIAIQGSDNVFVNGKGVVRIGDRVASHGLPPHRPNPPMVQGSNNVFVNGIGVVRAGDSANCGHKISGSSNVFVN
jgi:uncharacterized Zn-binding protein involved in type VI secretion